MKREPFRDVMIHATILTKEGKRMSKSLGTGVDPMDLIERYGADATRFGLIWQAMGNQDIHWSEEHVVAGRKFCNKVWNASRFVLLQIPNADFIEHPRQSRDKFQKPKSKTLTVADKKILVTLEKTKKEVSKRIEKYEFGQALHVLYDFFWHTYCDVYLEASKKQLNTEVLSYVLAESLKLLHPFLPFITEEIWSRLPIKNRKMLIVEQW
jgi:valyl-tRNA synthetase